MQNLILEQLAEKGIVTIQKRSDGWQVECVIKDEAGFLTDRQAEWGSELSEVIIMLYRKIDKRE